MCCFLALPHLFSAQGKDPSFFTHLSLNGFYSYYTGNKNHLDKIQPRISYSFCAREEWRFSRSGALVAGAEFFAHGMKFNSYFFSEGHSELYDKKFNYTYKVNLYEFGFPLLLRGNYMGRHRGKSSGYFEVGPSLRWLFSSSIEASDSTGATLYRGRTTPEFEYPLLKKPLTLYMQFNTGINFYNETKWSGMFIELNVRFAPIRFFIKESFTANSLYFQNLHAGLGLGFRF